VEEWESQEVPATGRVESVNSTAVRNSESAVEEVRTVEGRSCSSTRGLNLVSRPVRKGENRETARKKNGQRRTQVGQVPAPRVVLVFDEVELLSRCVEIATSDLVLHGGDGENALPVPLVVLIRLALLLLVLPIIRSPLDALALGEHFVSAPADLTRVVVVVGGRSGRWSGGRSARRAGKGGRGLRMMLGLLDEVWHATERAGEQQRFGVKGRREKGNQLFRLRL
jgi:hypothetical protein